MKNLLAAALGLLATGLFAQTNPVATHPLRVYVAGESIERRNRWVAAPFTASGALNDRGDGAARNDNDEYGWMVPLRDRLRVRASDLTIEFVGSDLWSGADDDSYTGTYPSSAPEPTSAISGTSIPSWLEQRRGELEAKTFCFDLAFASRGGNDLGNDDDEEYKSELKTLALLLAHGSTCQSAPVVVVTGHMPDDQRSGGSDADYAALELHRFVERARDAVTELAAAHPEVKVRFADQYTPFTQNKPTTAFPSEVWSTDGIPDYAKIVRQGDSYHPRRLASIYAGELAADALDLAELRALAGGATCSVAITGAASVCAGGSVTLDAGSGFASYLWSTGATTRAITVSPSATTAYTVSVTDGSGCQATSPDHTVAVNAAPDATIAAPGFLAAGSSGNTASLTDAGAGAAYAWTITGGTITAGGSARSITFTAGASGAVVLGATVTSAGCAGSATKTIPIGSAVAGPELLLPVVLDVHGLAGSHYTTELTLVSRAASTLTVALLYTAASGGGTGTGYVSLSPGEMRVVPDAIAFLRTQGVPIPSDDTSKVGSLLATFGGASSSGEVFLGGRTSTPGGGGTFGLFYPALSLEQSASTFVWVYGLRQDSTMRSNLAVINRGDAGDPVTLRVTYYGSSGAALGTPAVITLSPREWHQFDQPLQALGAAAAYAKVERVSGSSRFVAYGVLNDAATSDGSYVAMSF